ncbi:YveK family protein [Listeria booriae]|uniref:YveK family protein n=1 Tax=Listeria booriae TaxID=1552123 RepID=UPI0016264345|nr:Wzz/FepE/Etk N-terminal domain-containing protein [Listeria booriae]MBC1226936.1 capsule biosynthesis protein [Listeria booriae]MBC1233746.1 capsule biosynthesis protein [Listeria booriae]MBC1245994.1 capsule biosynthesis protein [Listeria booriae]
MQNSQTVISIFDILKIIKKNIWIILAIVIVTFVAVFTITNVILTPQYKATNQILVVQNTNKADSNVQNSEVQANLQMVNTYSAMIKSPLVLDKVSEKLRGQYSTNELSKKIVTSNDQNSQVLNIQVQDESQAMAAKIANETASAFKENLPIIMKDKSVTVMSQAKVLKNAHPVFPNKTMFYFLSLVAGLVLAGLFCFLREILDTTVKTEDQIMEKLGLPVLGTISKIPDNSVKNRPKYEAMNKTHTEAKPVYEK